MPLEARRRRRPTGADGGAGVEGQDGRPRPRRGCAEARGVHRARRRASGADRVGHPRRRSRPSDRLVSANRQSTARYDGDLIDVDRQSFQARSVLSHARSEEVRVPELSRSPCTIRFLQARVSCRLASRPPARFTAGQIASAHALAMRSGCASRVAAHPLAVAGATATPRHPPRRRPDIHCCLRR